MKITKNSRTGAQGGCERRIEVTVKMEKSRGGGGGGGSGWMLTKN